LKEKKKRGNFFFPGDMNVSSNWKALVTFPKSKCLLTAQEPEINKTTFSVKFIGESTNEEQPISVCITWKNAQLLCVDKLDIEKAPVVVETNRANGKVHVNGHCNEIVFEANLTELKTVCDNRTLLEMK
jgi:hypothetical protein